MIVITTPTGQIGSQVLGNLLDTGETRPRHRARPVRSPSRRKRSRRGRGRVTW